LKKVKNGGLRLPFLTENLSFCLTQKGFGIRQSSEAFFIVKERVKA